MESNMKDPALMQILDKWWASCLVLLDSDGNGTLERNEYVNLYKRLIYGTSCIYGEKAVLDQHIDDLIEEDWKRDSGGLLSMDKTRLCVSIYELAETWAKGEAVQTFVDFLTELHEHVFVSYKEEYLSQRKPSKKTPVLSKAKSTIKPKTPEPVKPTPATAVRNPKVQHPRKTKAKIPSITSVETASLESPPIMQPPALMSSSSSVEPPPPTIDQPPSPEKAPQEGDDMAYYSFEARFQLQERIEACQRQLQPIGHIAEIAWLRCTVREEQLHAQATSHQQPPLPQHHPSLAPYRVTAAAITAMGERVCIKLQKCLLHAEKSRVDDLILLVEDVERDVQSFIDAVTDVATSSCTSSHATTKQQQTRRHPTKHSPTHPNHHDLCFGNRNVSFDLPSMKTYAQQVAPSYAAYKPAKKPTR
ncbi:hypothetical protein AaE_007187 [Aphanomyces astaci]|uniref:EF-hand domain-containing protein n=1 Tax=Aphanomyces astaci TaxID=112090 RepID=A0A6A5AEX3_APHAT|nr:hypothetical protein AaE_007187 [Aphanomyces astaci]